MLQMKQKCIKFSKPQDPIDSYMSSHKHSIRAPVQYSARLQLSEEYEAKVEALRSALIEGERSGPPTSFDFDAFIADKSSS